MKVTYRIPTNDQYAFVELNEEFYDKDPEPAVIQEKYSMYLAAFKIVNGLSAKEIDSMLDAYFKGRGVDSNQYDRLNPEQLKWIQCIKRSLARVARAGDYQM